MSKIDSLTQLVDELFLSEQIEIGDIPNIDLYMEQVTSFMDDKLGSLKRNDKEKILTKTMINNYTKNGILMPPVNKKYSQSHMILMLLVYYLKQILSQDDIKKLLNPVLKDMTTTEDDVIPLEDIYSIFLDLKKFQFDSFQENIIEKYKFIQNKTKDLEDDEENTKEMAELFLVVIMLIAQANAQKRLAEKIIDNFFTKSSS